MNKFVKIGKALVNSDAIVSIKTVRDLSSWTVLITLLTGETIHEKRGSELSCELFIDKLEEQLNSKKETK